MYHSYMALILSLPATEMKIVCKSTLNEKWVVIVPTLLPLETLPQQSSHLIGHIARDHRVHGAGEFVVKCMTSGFILSNVISIVWYVISTIYCVEWHVNHCDDDNYNCKGWTLSISIFLVLENKENCSSHIHVARVLSVFTLNRVQAEH